MREVSELRLRVIAAKIYHFVQSSCLCSLSSLCVFALVFTECVERDLFSDGVQFCFVSAEVWSFGSLSLLVLGSNVTCLLHGCLVSCGCVLLPTGA